MKKICFVILTVIISFKISAQNIEQLLSKKILTCDEIVYNSTFLIPDYYRKNNIDTVYQILNFWENKCGLSEPLLRLKILLAINSDTLTESLYKEVPIINLISYYRDSRKNSLREFNYLNNVVSNSFDIFTKELAANIYREKKRLTQLDKFFLDIYSNKHEKIFIYLQDSLSSEKEIRQAYFKEVSKYEGMSEGHFSFYTGLWVPFNNLQIVGNHPKIGFKAGLKTKRFSIDGALEFKFGNSPNNYVVRVRDSTFNTNHFFGGYAGLEVGYEIFRKKSHEFNLLSGIAWDGFDALRTDNVNNQNNTYTKSLNSLNLNFGLGYRKYFKDRTYFGIEARYNLVNYRNENGTDLSGNTLSIRLLYGISRNLRRDINLLRLDHKKTLNSDPEYLDWINSQNYYGRF